MRLCKRRLAFNGEWSELIYCPGEGAVLVNGVGMAGSAQRVSLEPVKAAPIKVDAVRISCRGRRQFLKDLNGAQRKTCSERLNSSVSLSLSRRAFRTPFHEMTDIRR